MFVNAILKLFKCFSEIHSDFFRPLISNIKLKLPNFSTKVINSFIQFLKNRKLNKVVFHICQKKNQLLNYKIVPSTIINKSAILKCGLISMIGGGLIFCIEDHRTPKLRIVRIIRRILSYLYIPINRISNHKFKRNRVIGIDSLKGLMQDLAVSLTWVNKLKRNLVP